jgi:hypothetical protein
LRLWIALGCVAASACSFVVGTNKYVLGEDDAGDATLPEAGEDVMVTDSPTADIGPDAPPCSIAGCLAEAGVCGSSCGITSANCVAGCSNTPCKNSCLTQEAACRTACAASCNLCTVSAGCQNQGACNDAAAK